MGLTAGQFPLGGVLEQREQASATIIADLPRARTLLRNGLLATPPSLNDARPNVGGLQMPGEAKANEITPAFLDAFADA